ncbi:MAG: energy-coupling factor transporter ATPase [Clostridia bacterium]|nr:energy-coupling factor transporter ATPase [Clostridia bacterium]
MRVSTKQLNFTYNPRSAFASEALKNVTLDIPEGSFFGIIGHTGSGKSTFVSHLNGLTDVQGGEVQIGDVTLYNLKERKAKKKALKSRKKEMGEQAYERAVATLPCDKKQLKKDRIAVRERVGMVFQYPEYQLFAETVEEDVAFALRNFSAKKKKQDASFVLPTEEEVASAVRSAMEYVGLDYETYRHKSPFDLSGGQKRRVAIAGVLVAKPDVLVLDEPVAGLDPEGKAQLFDLLHTLHGKVCSTVVIVSHDMDDVAEHCTHVAVFDQGTVALVGSATEVFTRADLLTQTGLDVPLSAKLTAALKQQGITLSSDLTEDDFIQKTAACYLGGGFDKKRKWEVE